MTNCWNGPPKDGLGVLILIDEVLMYVREKVAADARLEGSPRQLLPVPDPGRHQGGPLLRRRVAAGERPVKGDSFGRQLQGELYDIFQRQREEAVEPVVKEDVAEVLRRRFFTPRVDQGSRRVPAARPGGAQGHLRHR